MGQLVLEGDRPFRECLREIVLLGESHLRAVVREYLTHYHQERNQQGLGGQLIVSPANLKPIVCRERLGGRLRVYHREALNATTGRGYAKRTE